MAQRWTPPSSSIPMKKVCGIPTCQCSEYVRGPPSLPIYPLSPTFIAGLLVINAVFFPSFIHYWFTGNEYVFFLAFPHSLPVCWKRTPSCFSLLFIGYLIPFILRPALLGLAICVAYVIILRPSTTYHPLQTRQSPTISLPLLLLASFLHLQLLFLPPPSLSLLTLLLHLLLVQSILGFLQICQCQSSGHLNYFRVNLLRQVRKTGERVWHG